jgi:3-oxoacyl-[acyl-carrier protein] reductase
MFGALKDKRVLVTGASSGIGAAIAKLFGSHSAKVGVHFNSNIDGAERVAETIRNGPGNAESFQGDLLEESVRRGLVGRFISRFGGIDVLVNNAGYFSYKHFLDLDEADWDKLIALYIKAPFTLMQKAFLDMRDRRWGRIINISTVGLKYGGTHNMNYSAPKAAMEAMLLGFAREGAPCNVLVNTVRCGLIDTPMREKVPDYGEERFRERARKVPLGRAGKPIDVARMVVYLASSGGDFITGQTFAVSGGD